MNEHSFGLAEETQRAEISTRDRIMGAATETIAAQGYANTSVREIIQRAGVSIGSFYTYFARKEDVMIAVIREAGKALRIRLQETYRSLVEQHRNGALPPTEEGLVQSFFSLYTAFFAFVKEKRKLFLVVFREGVLADPAITPATEDVFTELTEDIEERIAFASQIGMMRKMGKGERRTVAEAIVGMLVHSAQSFLEAGASRYASRLKTLVAFSVGGTMKRRDLLKGGGSDSVQVVACPKCGCVVWREGE